MSTPPSPRIGLVGVGRMGANMARRLADRGFTLTALYDLNAASAAELARELGCTATPSLAEVTAQSDFVLTVVSDDNSMRDIFTHPEDNLLKAATGRVFINCATVSPEIHRELAPRIEEAGATAIEACMASSITQARDGSLFLIVAGAPEVIERTAPILDALASARRYVGATGRAAEVKALVNMVMNINTAGLAEGLGLGSALGLDLTALREIFSKTGAASRVLETDGEDMQNRDHACFFSIAHAAKDSGIAYALAEQSGLTLPLAEATLRQYTKAVEAGLGALDKSGIAELTFPDRTSP